MLLSIIENIEDPQTHKNLRSRLLIGGQGRSQEDALDIREGCFQFIVGTIGRVRDVLRKYDFLNNLRVLVLDEADHLLRSAIKDKKKQQDLGRSLDQIIREVAKKGRVLLYSATYEQQNESYVKKQLEGKIEKIVIEDNKEEEALEEETLKRHYFAVFGPTDDFSVFEAKVLEMVAMLESLKDVFEQVLVFYNHKVKGEELATELRAAGW